MVMPAHYVHTSTCFCTGLCCIFTIQLVTSSVILNESALVSSHVNAHDPVLLEPLAHLDRLSPLRFGSSSDAHQYDSGLPQM